MEVHVPVYRTHRVFEVLDRFTIYANASRVCVVCDFPIEKLADYLRFRVQWYEFAGRTTELPGGRCMIESIGTVYEILPARTDVERQQERHPPAVGS